MHKLTVNQYNQAEQDGLIDVPLTAFGAFQPEYFQQFGYVTRVKQESELRKFVDPNHDRQYEHNINSVLGGLTFAEFDLVQSLTKTILNFTESSFGIKSVARGNISRSLNVLRHIRHIFGDSKPAIFEVGPGAGYLGAMLIHEGYPYAATDITQSLYLYQNHLWNAISDGKVIDLVTESSGGFPDPLPGIPVHIPWWEFIKQKPGMTPKFDVVTSNDCINEMAGRALGFTLSIAKGYGSEPNNPIFVIDGWGSQLATGLGTSSMRFHRAGFVPVHRDGKITIMVPRGGFDYFGLPKCPSIIQRAFGKIFRLATATEPTRSLHSFHHFDLPVNISLSNPWSNAILEDRKLLVKPVSIEQLNIFYKEILGGEVPLTSNEEFLLLAGTYY